MLDQENPQTWTVEYVNQHRTDCLLALREANLQALRHLQEGRYLAASVSLEALVNGFAALRSSRAFGEARSWLALYSRAVGELAALVDPDRFIIEARTYGTRPRYAPAETRKQLRRTALSSLEEARDLARGGRTLRCAAGIAQGLREGVPPDQLRQEYAPNFPTDLREDLLDADSRFFVPLLCRYAPDRCWYLDPDRLLLTTRLDPRASGASAGPEGGERNGGDPGDFDQWAADNGWDEEDLDWAYGQVRRRRNIYGALLLVPLLGLLVMPFWARAVYLTRALERRDLDVETSLPVKIIFCLFALPTLFLYPLLMLAVIRRSNWGMGLGDRRGRALTLLLAAVLAAASVFSLAAGGPGRLAALPDTLADLPGNLSALLRGERRVPPEEPPEEASPLGRWYTVTLYYAPEDPAESIPEEPPADLPEETPDGVPEEAPENIPEPVSLVFQHYHFWEGGACDRTYRCYARGDAGLEAFGARWRLEQEESSRETYALRGERWLSICAEGAPPDQFFSNSDYDRTYGWELRDGALLLTCGDAASTVYLPTELDGDQAEQILADLSGSGRRLAGSWTAARREGTGENPEIRTETYTFRENGTFERASRVYLNSAYVPNLAGGAQGWFPAPTGNPVSRGTCVFDGRSLALTLLSAGGEDGGLWTMETEAWPAETGSGGALILDGRRYVPDNGDREAVWDAIGVDDSVS